MKRAKPNLIVLFKEGGLNSYPFNIPVYRESYKDLCKLVARYFSIYIVRGLSHYRGRGIFEGCFHYERGKLKYNPRRVKASVVFNKGDMMSNGGRDWTVVNKGGLMRVANQKNVTHQVFARWMKSAYRVTTKSGCQRALQKVRGAMAVFKPVEGKEGEGVVISEKGSLLKRLNRYNGLIEEFIDTSGGFAKHHFAAHDLRMTMMDGVIVETYLRTPPAGSLVANVARGGSIHMLTPQSLPRSARQLARKVDRMLARYHHRVYSVDVGYEGKRPYIIEINGEPGLPFKRDSRAVYRRWHRTLLNVFLACVRDTRIK